MSRISVRILRFLPGAACFLLVCAAASGPPQEAARKALQRAESLFREKRYREAIPAFVHVLELNPESADAHFALGICYSQTGDHPRARAELEVYTRARPDSGDGHAALGLVLLTLGNAEDARRELLLAIRQDPNLTPARVGLARTAWRQRQYSAALAYLEPLLRAVRPAEPEVYAIAARCLFNRHEQKRALAVCERGLAYHPGSTELEALHVTLLLDCREEEICRQRAIECLAQKPRSPNYVKAVAELLIDRDRTGGMTAAMVKRMIDLLPADPAARYLHAKWLMVSNVSHDRAVYEAARDEAAALRALPEAGAVLQMQCLTTMAQAEDALGHSDRADLWYRQALELNRSLAPPNPAAAMHYAWFLGKTERSADAAAVLDEILRWTPEFGPARLERARSLAAAGRTLQAVDEANRAIECGLYEATQLRAAHYLLAGAYASLGREREAAIERQWLAKDRSGGTNR